MTSDTSRAKVERLDTALAALEAAVSRAAASERSRADLTDSLAVMDDDRQRLAAELDSALFRAGTLERAGEAVEQRLRAASERLRRLLDEMGER